MFSSSPWYSRSSRLGKSFDRFARLKTANLLTSPDFAEQNPDLFVWIEEKRGEPFFAYIHTLDAHEPRFPFNTDDSWLDKEFPESRDRELRLWAGAPFDKEDQNHIRNLYDGGVRYADSTVGTIVRHLEDLNILDNTLIIVSSDHGEILATDGATLGHPSKRYADELFRVPFVISGPGLPEGARFAQRSENVDILPTIAELLNLQHKSRFDGLSLMPIIRGEEHGEVHSFIYAKAEDLYFSGEPRHILYGESAKYTIAGTRNDDGSILIAQLERDMEVSSTPDTGIKPDQTTRSPSELNRAAKYLEESVLPAWDRYFALSETVPPVFQLSHVEVFMKELLTDKVEPNDGLWTREVNGDPYTPSTSVRYVAFNDTEQVPRIGNVCRVPGGRYRVSILASTYSVDGVERASSFRLNTESPEDFHQYRLEPESSTKRSTEWMELGEFDLPEGIFYYHIEAGLAGDVSAFGGFRFQDLSQEERPELDVERVEEELKSVGYLK